MSDEEKIDVNRDWQEDEFAKLVWELAKLSKTKEVFDMLTAQIQKDFEENIVTLLDEEDEGAIKALKDLQNYETLIDGIIPVYQKYYSLDDLKKLIEFMRTPVGVRIMEVQPMLTQEIMEIQQARAIKFVKKLDRKESMTWPTVSS